MFFAVLLFDVLATSRLPAQVEGLAVDSWVHEELTYFEALGWVELPGVRPYTRRQVQEWLAEWRAFEAADNLSPATKARLARLRDEFERGEAVGQAFLRFDPPLLRFEEGRWGFLADADVSTGSSRLLGSTPEAGQSGTTWGRTHLETVLRHADWLTYQTRYNVSIQEEEGDRVDKNFLSSRERNWRGVTSDHDRSYVAVDGGRFRAVLGREYVGWGMQRGDELLISDQGFSMDALQMHLHLGRYRVASVNALLSNQSQRWFSAHRLEITFGGFLLGLQEAVVYQSPSIDPTYFFPFSYYYGNQFNERSDDNVFMGIDAKWSTGWGVWDAELMVDDFIYDGDPAPQKLGFRAGWRRAFETVTGGWLLEAAYLGLTRWTYTHRDVANAYVAGSGDLEAGDPFIGHSLGPDADRMRLALTWTPNTAWRFSTVASRTRRGEGNRDTSAWVPGDEYRVGFPSGVRQNENWLALESRYRWQRRFELATYVAYGHTFAGRQGDLRARIRWDF